MKTKQEVKLLYISPLVLISNSIRYSHATWDKRGSEFIFKCKYCGYCIDESKARVDEETGKYYCRNCSMVEPYVIDDAYLDGKDFDLIKRVGFKLKHSSVLEFGSIIFNVKMSTKALLEESRHRIGISQTVTSSRYSLRKIELEYEPTGDEEIDKDMDMWMNIIKKRLEQNKSLDNVSKMLPQAFLYRLQLQFNLRSLLHFLRLRLAKDAHKDIRIIAYLMYQELTDDYKELIKEDEVIEKHLIRCKDEGFDKLLKN
jgi:thymidylate synthase ThyX